MSRENGLKEEQVDQWPQKNVFLLNNQQRQLISHQFENVHIRIDMSNHLYAVLPDFNHH